MRPYAERKALPQDAILLWRQARLLVDFIPERVGRDIRCHELARVIARVLGPELTVKDGLYGRVQHSWLVGDGFVLDVYAPGRLPQVQLIDDFFTLPERDLYKAGEPRSDIDEEWIEATATVLLREVDLSRV